MTLVIWSPQSLHDLESIRAYIAEDSAAYAELVVRRIVAVVERLHTVYRRHPDVVEIVTVFRGSREFPESVL